MTSQPAPPIWRWSLPTTLILLNLTLPTLAAFVPVTGRPIPQLRGGLNLYPADQGNFDDFSFRENEKHLDRGFHDPLPKPHQHHQNNLMDKIHDGFFGEFERYDYDNVSHDKLYTRGDAFKYSTSRNSDSWGKFRAGPANKRALHAPKIARITLEDVQPHTVCIVYI